MQSGFLFLDKAAGMTSHDAVMLARRAARTRRVGHAGTLDPFATGLLVLAVGDATRLLRFIDGEPKVYLAGITFGVATDTDDVTGTPIARGAIPHEDKVLGALPLLTGNLSQVPPAYSAKRVGGVRSYSAARKGVEVKLAPASVTVHSWEVAGFTGDRLLARITCSGGTYVRALARDLGRLSGTVAHCDSLRREASGPIHVDRAHGARELTPGCIADGALPLVSPLELLGSLERVELDDGLRESLRQGRLVEAGSHDRTPGSKAVFVDRDMNVLGVGEALVLDGRWWWQPRVVLSGNPEGASL